MSTKKRIRPACPICSAHQPSHLRQFGEALGPNPSSLDKGFALGYMVGRAHAIENEPNLCKTHGAQIAQLHALFKAALLG